MTTETAADLSFDEIAVGDEFTLTRTITADDVRAFAEVSGDFSPLHVDADYAATTEFGGQVVHGMLLASLFSNLVGMKVPGRPALYLGQELSFRKPVLVGETVEAKAKVTAKNPGTATLSLACEVRNAAGKLAVSGNGKVKVRDTVQSAAAGVSASEAASPTTDLPYAVVTGGSRGIGAHIARHLGASGFGCLIVYRADDAAAARTADDIAAQGGTARTCKADITDPTDLGRLAALIAKDKLPVSALVNGAIGELTAIPAADLSWDDVSHHLDTQVKAVLALSQNLYPVMKARGGGAIVNLLSQVVHNTPPPQMAHYVIAKYGLMGLSKALASEWAGDGIRVNMVSPGLAKTELTQHYADRVFKMEAVKTPLGRLVEPDDIARTVAYLLGDGAQFITGTNLFLTGGQNMP